MKYLGLSVVRDHGIGPLTPATQAAKLGQMASGGLRFDWLTGGAIGPTMTALDAFVAAHPGSIETIEGPNEVDNFAFAYDGLSGAAAADAYQADLWSATEADPFTDGAPLLSFTGAPEAPGSADAANVHIYPKAGAQPLAALTAAVTAVQRQMPGASVYVTEAGYFTLPGPHGWEGVDNATQAKLTLNLVMDAAKLGVSGVDLYDLIDDGPDPTGSKAVDHFGLFTTAGTAKPSAVAIHNLTSILADPGATAGTFKTTPLSYTVSGLPASGASLVLEQSSGAYDILLWAEPQIWSTATNAPVAAPPSTVTVGFSTALADVSVFDPTGSDAPLQTANAVSAVTVTVTDHPLIIQVSNLVQAMAMVGAVTSAAPLAVTDPPHSTTVPLLAKP